MALHTSVIDRHHEQISLRPWPDFTRAPRSSPADVLRPGPHDLADPLLLRDVSKPTHPPTRGKPGREVGAVEPRDVEAITTTKPIDFFPA